MLETSFDSYAATYDAALQLGLGLSGESKEYFAAGRIDWLSARLTESGSRPRHVLDYGCGTGAGAALLARAFPGASVLGVDTSTESVARAAMEYGGASVRFASVAATNPSAAHDLVYCNGVFHHIEPQHRSAALAYVHESLSPGGLFAFFENNPWNPGTRVVMARIPFDRDAHLISPRQAERLLAGAGFTVVRRDFLFFFPRALAALRRLEPRLHRLPAGAQYMVLCRKNP